MHQCECLSLFWLSCIHEEPASPSIQAGIVHLALLSVPLQSFTPTSSSRVNTPSAWCHVAWERTRRCISSWARPWCTLRRLSPSRAASLSSTTPTVCGLFQRLRTQTSLSLVGTKYTFSVSFFTLILVHPARPLCHLYFSPWLHFPPSLFCHFVPSCPCFLSSSCCFIITFHQTLYRLCHFLHNHSHFYSCSPLFFLSLLLHLSLSFSRCIACFLSNPPLALQPSHSAFLIPYALRAPPAPTTSFSYIVFYLTVILEMRASVDTEPFNSLKVSRTDRLSDAEPPLLQESCRPWLRRR